MNSAFRKFSLLVLVAFVASIVTAQMPAIDAASAVPSFNCSLAKDAIDKTICQEPELAKADAVMARLYSAARTSAFGRGPSNELVVQREWLKIREQCRVVDRVYASRAECLTNRYTERNHELAVASLFTEPALALETLRKLDPEATPLYEALVIYAGEPANSVWSKAALATKRARILNLIQPYADQFHKDEDWRYGREILENAGLTQIDKVLKSDEGFASFIQITSAYLDGDPIPRPMPCAAIVRNANLLGATGPVFGSTLDNFILYPDCEGTLPPLPRLTSLVDQLNESWPDCEGTIRFSGYRIFGLAVNAARVASLKDISGSGGAMPRLTGVSVARVTAAIDELAGYYQHYRRVKRAQAKSFATNAVRGIMTAGHYCAG